MRAVVRYGASERARDPDFEIDGRGPLPASHLRLTDGGLYDNLGIEPAIKRHKVVFISDGGAVITGTVYGSDGRPRSGIDVATL